MSSFTQWTEAESNRVSFSATTIHPEKHARMHSDDRRNKTACLAGMPMPCGYHCVRVGCMDRSGKKKKVMLVSIDKGFPSILIDSIVRSLMAAHRRKSMMPASWGVAAAAALPHYSWVEAAAASLYCLDKGLLSPAWHSAVFAWAWAELNHTGAKNMFAQLEENKNSVVHILIRAVVQTLPSSIHVLDEIEQEDDKVLDGCQNDLRFFFSMVRWEEERVYK